MFWKGILIILNDIFLDDVWKLYFPDTFMHIFLNLKSWHSQIWDIYIEVIGILYSTFDKRITFCVLNDSHRIMAFIVLFYLDI